jgi:hypothetical protein
MGAPTSSNSGYSQPSYTYQQSAGAYGSSPTQLEYQVHFNQH